MSAVNISPAVLEMAAGNAEESTMVRKLRKNPGTIFPVYGVGRRGIQVEMAFLDKGRLVFVEMGATGGMIERTAGRSYLSQKNHDPSQWKMLSAHPAARREVENLKSLIQHLRMERDRVDARMAEAADMATEYLVEIDSENPSNPVHTIEQE